MTSIETTGRVIAAAVQFNHVAGNKPANLAIMERFVDDADSRGVRILAFPEMCITGYWHLRNLTRDQLVDLAEFVPAGPSTAVMQRWARERGMLIGGGLLEIDADGRLYNSYVCCLPDGVVHVHRKIHCFVSSHMSSGDKYTVFDTPWGIRVGVLICWDNNLIENVRITALLGADVLMAPHQTGGCNSRSPHAMGRIDVDLWHRRHEDPAAIEAELRGPKGREWLMRWLPSRAHDNGMFLIFSNGVGIDDDEVRTGNAMILDCYGRILTETNRADDDMVVASLDLELLPRCTGRRWIRGRRPELYDKLVSSTGMELDPRAARFSEMPVEKRPAT